MQDREAQWASRWLWIVEQLDDLYGACRSQDPVAQPLARQVYAELLLLLSRGSAAPWSDLDSRITALEQPGLGSEAQAVRSRISLAWARILDRVNRRRDALAHLDSAIQLAEAAQEKKVALVAKMEKADLLRRCGSFAEAQELLSRVVKKARQWGMRREEADALNGLGNIFLEVGKPAEAEIRFQTALELAWLLDDPRLAGHLANNLGVSACIRGEVEEGYRLLNRALVSRDRVGDAKGYAETYHNLGMAARQMGRGAAASDYFRHAAINAALAQDGTTAANVDLGEAELYVDLGELELARFHAARARESYTGTGDLLGVAEAGRVLGTIALQEGDLETAKKSCDSSIRLFQEHGSPLGEAETTEITARIARARGDLGVARKTLMRAATLFGMVGNEKKARQLRNEAAALA